jgi:hypothetical protein
MALVRELIRDVAQKIRPCPRETILNAYVRAARQFCGETRWYRVNLDAATVANQQLYSLGSDPFIEIVDVPFVSMVTNPGVSQANIVPLVNQPSNAFNPNIESDTPIWYSYIPEAQIAFSPIPDSAYPVSMTLVCQPRDGVTEIPNEILPKWRLAFEAGALAYLYGLTGEPFADPREAAKYEAVFRSYINSGKASVAMGFQSGSQRATPRRFVTR